MSNIEDLIVYKITKDVHNQLGEDFASKNSIQKDIEEAMDRNAKKLYLMEKASDDLKKSGKNPYPCFNLVCPDNIEETNSCKKGVLCHDCFFQMTTKPPNSLEYSMNNKFPSHQEALDLLVENGILKDENWERQLETIYFRDQKKPTTQYNRGQEEIKGVTMDQFRGLILNFLEEFFNNHETIIGKYTFGPIAPDFDFTDESDREIFARDICIGIEKVMGIYPNIRKLR